MWKCRNGTTNNKNNSSSEPNTKIVQFSQQQQQQRQLRNATNCIPPSTFFAIVIKATEERNQNKISLTRRSDQAGTEWFVQSKRINPIIVLLSLNCFPCSWVWVLGSFVSEWNHIARRHWCECNDVCVWNAMKVVGMKAMEMDSEGAKAR